MFCEKLPNGKVRYGEYYKCPLTLKNKKVSVCMDKDTPSNRKKALAELNRRIEDKTCISDSTKITFRKLLDEYLNYQLHTVEKSTYTRNKCTLNKCIKKIGESVYVNNVNARHIKNIFMPNNDDEITKSNEYIKRIKAMLLWGYENELVTDYNLPNKLKSYKTNISKKEKIKDKYLEPEELNGILSYLEKHKLWNWYYLTQFLSLTGLRIGEALALNNDDVDLKGNNISVNKTLYIAGSEITDPKTYASNRDVFIQPELRSVIENYLNYRNISLKLRNIRNSKLFFIDDNGGFMHYDAYRKQLKLAASTITDKKVTPHILRHTHASLLMSQGVNIDTISRRLGHEDSKITKEIYLHVTKLLIDKDKAQLNQVNLL